MQGYLPDTAFIPAHHLPGALIDLVQDQGIDTHRLFRHTSLFPERVIQGDAVATPREFLQLIHNSRQLFPDPELPFRYGQRLLPGHYGPISALLGQAGCLRDCLVAFNDYPALISPLVGVRITLNDEYLCVQWLDSCGAGSHWPFLVESAMAGLASVSQWLSHRPLPWQFQFSYRCPPWPEQYQVHLGERLHFERCMDAMLLPRHYLDMPWPRGASTGWQAARQQCDQQIQQLGFAHSARQQLYRFLQQAITSPPTLQDVANHYGSSPATIKRRLKQQGCHYQRLLDEVRLHQAILWIQFDGMTPDQVCRRLNFSDSTNFRRAFKRWSGLTPAACHKILQALSGH